MPTHTQTSILFVLTSADKTLDGKPIGWYLPEAAHPWFALRDYFNIVFASPKGGVAPLDQSSVENFKDEQSVTFLNDSKTKYLVKNTHKLSNIKEEDYVAIFVVGGHGPMIDLAFDKEFAKLVEQFYAAGKPVAAVCHGPAALIQAKKPYTDESILSGVQVTGFSNSEEAQTPYNDFVNTLPFSLEDKLRELGAKYEKADDWAAKVCWDGRILTGQNPASAGPLGEKLSEILRTFGAVPVAKDYADDI